MAYEKNNSGEYPSLVLSDDCGYDEFYRVASNLEEKLNIKYTRKMNDFDSLFWDFMFESRLFTIHYNIYMGISVYPSAVTKYTRDDEKALDELNEKISAIV